MTVFRSKTFKKNRPSRISRKLWRKAVKTVKTRKTRKQRGGYVLYRANPVGGVYADVLDWDDNKEKTA
jgi:hypothetical protein